MATYTGKPTTVQLPASAVFERLSNLSDLQSRMDSLPDDLKAKMGTVNFPDADTLAFTAPGVGEMKFRLVERTATSRVKFLADTGLMPIYVVINLNAVTENSTEISAAIEADIPMMMRPLVGGKLQEAADKFGEMFAQLNSPNL